MAHQHHPGSGAHGPPQAVAGIQSHVREPGHTGSPGPAIDSDAYERRWGTLAVLCLSLLLANLDTTILNVALPTLARELSATSSELQWIIDAYVIVFAGLMLTSGALGDRFGRRRALFAGLAVLAVGSTGAAASGSAGLLIASRAIMGLGGAFIMPATLSILTTVFPPRERAKAIAIWASTAALGVPLGPILGGWLLEHFAWGSVFLVNLPVVAVAAVAAVVLVPDSRDPTEKPLDPAGALLSIAALGTLVFAIIEAPSNGWTSATTLCLLVLSAVFLGAFIRWETRRNRPMLDMSLFRKPSFTGASLAIALVFFALLGTLFALTQYLQFVLGYGALGAGVRMTPLAVGLIAGNSLSARLLPRLGTRVIVTAGLLVTAAGLAVLATISDGSGYGTALIAFLVLGFGMGNTSAPATNSVMSSVPRENAGVGAALNNTVRPVGGALGVAVLGSILSTAYRSSMEDATSGLPGSAADAASDSIGAAIRVAARIGGSDGDALVQAARSSFIDAMGTAVLVAAGVAVLGAVVAATVLPPKSREDLAAPSSHGMTAHGRAGPPAHAPPDA
jgi:EmrB/QacA subfamily drug resistance transporter